MNYLIKNQAAFSYPMPTGPVLIKVKVTPRLVCDEAKAIYSNFIPKANEVKFISLQDLIYSFVK